MLKKIVIIIMSFVIGGILVSCNNKVSQSSDDKEIDSSVVNDIKIELDSDSSVLIAYFSWAGHTKELVNEIQKQVGGDLFEIQTQELYTDDINVLSKQSLQEQQDNIRPVLSSHIENMDKYDVVFIGYPNWWSNMPMPVFTFLEEYNFSGKTLIPFTTYGESGFGDSIDSINEILTKSHIIEGPAIQEHELNTIPDKVKEFLETIGFVK